MGRPDVARAQVVVVRDGEREALQNPPLKAFTRFSDVVYVHAAEDAALPLGSHYFFNCLRADERLYRLSDQAVRRGASVTFIVRYVDAALADFVRERGLNLMPAYGVGHQITSATLYRGIGAVLAGHRVVPEAFISNSIARWSSPLFPDSNTVIRLLTLASRLAHTSTTIVAAVLSLHRTGSNFLRDLIGLTVSGHVGVFHEHAIPPVSPTEPDPKRPLFDQQSVERDASKGRAIRRAILRDMILRANRRFIFVCDRDPVERLTSYFQERHMARLVSSYDSERQMLRNADDIQRTFDQWVTEYARRQRHWYERQLVHNFGLNVLEAVRTNDGFLLAENGENMLIVVPTARLSGLRDALAAAFGANAYALTAANSVTTRWAFVDRAFRRQIQFHAATADMLRNIPEVAYIHGQSSQHSITDGLPSRGCGIGTR